MATLVLIYALSGLAWFVVQLKAPNENSFQAGPAGLLLGSATLVLLALGLLVLDLVKWMVAKLCRNKKAGPQGTIGKQ